MIVKDGAIYPLEIKKTDSPKKDAVQHFSVLNKLDETIASGGVICLTEHSLPLTETTFSIPVAAL